MFPRAFIFALSVLMSAMAAPIVWAQSSPALDPGERQRSPSATSRTANSGTIGVISGGADGTYIRIAADLANVLDGDQMRILPIIGRGSLQNLRDIMFLRGIDVGIVQMDAREGLRAENLQGEALQRLRYIARLYNEEVHILASRDITDLRQLSGRKVNIDKAGSGTNLTARIIFERLGIQPEFTTYDQAASYERLRSGEIQAAVYIAGRPVRAISEFKSEGRFHLLAVPFEGELAETYLPARFSATDYPSLVEAGRDVETLAVGNILAVFNWPTGSDRYRRVERFVNEFFSRFDEFLQPGRHPKWKEVNISATVPGWERFKPAEDWLNRASREPLAADAARDFERYLQRSGSTPVQLSTAERERLLHLFLDWQRARTRNP